MGCCQYLRTMRRIPEGKKKKRLQKPADNFASVYLYCKLFLDISELVLYSKCAS